MNLAHLHLILNHIPIVGLPIGLAFLAYGYHQKHGPTQRFAVFVLVGLAMIILPVYFTGEPAEKIAEHLPGVTEAFIETHESAAELSLILTLVMGASSILTVWFRNDAKKNSFLTRFTLFVGIVAVASLVYTANLGGKVRHTEFRSDAENSTPAQSE